MKKPKDEDKKGTSRTTSTGKKRPKKVQKQKENADERTSSSTWGPMNSGGTGD